MIMLPEKLTELDPNLRWIIPQLLSTLENVIREPRGAKTGEPSLQEAEWRMGLATARRDHRAEQRAIAAYLRVLVRESLQDFSEEPLLTRLYERTALRLKKSGTPDRRRRPSHAEGLRIARAMLDDVRRPEPLDTERETETTAAVLAGHGPLTIYIRSRARVREIIKESRKNRVHFDALNEIILEWERLGEPIPRRLARWRQEVADGLLPRPDPRPIPPHRPANPAQVAYEMHIQFTIEILDRLGVPPQGSPTSGCGIVTEAMEEDISEDTVVHIWKRCPWRTSFLPAVRKYSKDIADRQGL